MNGSPLQTRKPYDTAPYATLRPPDVAAEDKSAPPANQPLNETALNSFAQETEKLQALRQALWAAFEAGPDGGVPTTLIDLTIAYTNALRLQLNLKSLSSRTLTPRQRAALEPRVDGVSTR